MKQNSRKTAVNAVEYDKSRFHVYVPTVTDNVTVKLKSIHR